ncbi:hypothetical protein DB88DRAFT_544856 [Papiliotrema laurentii]|uniref:Uncharacterized protein n=1 Tax=Papiliotrema laurentii TaxID=5418 RepID=A0AAD9FUW4_PAPLA|nr:hypothetical protein DB88DRAFT_544856 [Papiliotrema laurentii]
MHRMVTFVFATNSVEFAIFVHATSLWAAIAASVSATVSKVLIVLALGLLSWLPHLVGPLPHPERSLPHPECPCDLLSRIRRSLGVTGVYSNKSDQTGTSFHKILPQPLGGTHTAQKPSHTTRREGREREIPPFSMSSGKSRQTEAN